MLQDKILSLDTVNRFITLTENIYIFKYIYIYKDLCSPAAFIGISLENILVISGTQVFIYTRNTGTRLSNLVMYQCWAECSQIKKSRYNHSKLLLNFFEAYKTAITIRRKLDKVHQRFIACCCRLQMMNERGYIKILLLPLPLQEAFGG